MSILQAVPWRVSFLLFQSNTEIQSLNLSWNGFGMEGCHEMGKALTVNKSLTELDLSSNRVCFDAFRLLLQGLVQNTTVRILKVSKRRAREELFFCIGKMRSTSVYGKTI